jgi:hypothetical protein
MTHALEDPPPLRAGPRYTPFSSGRYDVAPGLHAFGTDFGNGAMDQCVFQIDHEFSSFLSAKRAARTERLGKYYQTRIFDTRLGEAVFEFMRRRVTSEYPGHFTWNPNTNLLTCRLTGERLTFNASGIDAVPESAPPYRDALDALAMQVQEDIAVVTVDADGGSRLDAIHLCHPNHWAAEDKIGRSFYELHRPVPGMTDASKQTQKLLHALVHRGPYVRFAWGISTDTRLNHHPEPPSDVPADPGFGRSFDACAPRAWIRVERQVLWGLPDVNAFMFTIRTSFMDCVEIKQDTHLRDALIAAVQSMSDATLNYKGLSGYRDALLNWLRA